MSPTRQSAEQAGPQPIRSLKESWGRGKHLVVTHVAIHMVLFPIAIAFAHAPGVSIPQTYSGITAVSVVAALALTRWRPESRPTSWRMGFVVLLGYGIGEMALGIQQYSPAWSSVRNALGLYFGLLLVMLVYRLGR